MNFTLISATNRKGSQTLKVARHYHEILNEHQIEHRFFSLEDLPEGFLNNKMYDEKITAWQKIMEEVLFPTDKYFIIMPEYNGSLPGILKLFIDASDVKKAFWQKKVCLTGVAAGRAGNLRGMEHLTGSLLHLKMQVFHNRLPISSIDDEIDESGKLFKQSTLKAVSNQVKGFLEF